MIQTKTEERLQYFIDHITYKPEWKIEIPHPLRDRREWHIDNGIVVSTRVVCDPENPYVTCPLPVTNPVCRDCDCDKPERRDARECRQLREDIESYRRDCVGFLHGVWKDGVCETHSTKRIPKGHTSPIKKNWESWENVECVSIHDGTEKP